MKDQHGYIIREYNIDTRTIEQGSIYDEFVVAHGSAYAFELVARRYLASSSRSLKRMFEVTIPNTLRDPCARVWVPQVLNIFQHFIGKKGF